MASPRSRSWVFTINNWLPNEEPLLLSEEWKQSKGGYEYLIIGKENTGEDGQPAGTPHLQGYVCWVNKRRLTDLKKVNGRACWLVARAQKPFQASDYCKKQNKWEEWGTLPQTGNELGGQASAGNWERIHELAKANDYDGFMREFPQQSFLNLNKFERLVEFYKPKPTDLERIENFWFIGGPGSGKSRTARQLYGHNMYVKPTASKWWPGYDGQETVLIDDLGKGMEYVLEWMKNWCDWYPFNGEKKSGHTGLIRPKRFVITSNYRIEEITNDEMLREAVNRRFTLVHFGKGLGEFQYDPNRTSLLQRSGTEETLVLEQNQLEDDEFEFNPDQFAQACEDLDREDRDGLVTVIDLVSDDEDCMC